MDNVGIAAGGLSLAGGAATAYGVSQGLTAARIGMAGARDVELVLTGAAGRGEQLARETAQRIDSTVTDTIGLVDQEVVGAARRMDAAYLSARQPIDLLTDHLVHSDFNGPVKLVRYANTAQDLAAPASAELNKQLDVVRQTARESGATVRHATLSATDAVRATSLDAVDAATQIGRESAAGARATALDAVSLSRGPALRAAVAGAAGIMLLAAGIGTGTVAVLGD